MFREAHRSSSGALNCICSLCSSHSALATAGHHMGT